MFFARHLRAKPFIWHILCQYNRFCLPHQRGYMTAAVAVTILFFSLIGGLFLWERAALREGCLCVGKRKRHDRALVWAQSCLTCFNSVHAHGVQPPLTARSGRDNYNRYYQCTAGSMLCQENCTSIRHLPPVFASHSLAICKSLTSWLCQLPTRLSGTGFPYARSSPKKPLKPTRRRCRTGTA